MTPEMIYIFGFVAFGVPTVFIIADKLTKGKLMPE